MENVNLDVHTTREERFSGRITASMIREAFNLPKDAEIFFSVPGGGDWSNTTLSVDEYPIGTRWKRVVEEESNETHVI